MRCPAAGRSSARWPASLMMLAIVGQLLLVLDERLVEAGFDLRNLFANFRNDNTKRGSEEELIHELRRMNEEDQANRTRSRPSAGRPAELVARGRQSAVSSHLGLGGSNHGGSLAASSSGDHGVAGAVANDADRRDISRVRNRVDSRNDRRRDSDPRSYSSSGPLKRPNGPSLEVGDGYRANGRSSNPAGGRPIRSSPRQSGSVGQQSSPVDGFVVDGGEASNDALDRDQLKPRLRLRGRAGSPLLGSAELARQQRASIERDSRGRKRGLLDSKYFTGKYLRRKMNEAYERGVKPVMGALAELPAKVQQASDTINAKLKLDGRGRLLALLESVDEDIGEIKSEFSRFSILWSRFTEDALRYLGVKNLQKFNCKPVDELDFCADAFNLLAFAHEFMRFMIIWRENMLIAFEAYKLYVETVKEELIESKRLATTSQEQANDSSENDYVVDDYFLIQLNATRAYFLTRAWYEIEYASLESQMKLKRLFVSADSERKNYERKYFRNLIILQEWYGPYLWEFCNDQVETLDTLIKSGFSEVEFKDIELFYDDFKDKIFTHKVNGIDWSVPSALSNFMNRIEPHVQYSTFIYPKEFLLQLKETKERVRRNPRPRLRMKRICQGRKRDVDSFVNMSDDAEEEEWQQDESRDVSKFGNYLDDDEHDSDDDEISELDTNSNDSDDDFGYDYEQDNVRNHESRYHKIKRIDVDDDEDDDDEDY